MKEKKDKCHIIAVLTAQERENLSQLQWYWLAKKKRKSNPETNDCI